MRKWLKWSIGSLAVLAVFASTASADDLGDLRAEMKQMKAKLNQQDETIQQLRNSRNSEDVGRIHKEEMAEMMKEILDDAKIQPAMPKWMKNLKFYGDFRLRYQHDSRGWNNEIRGRVRKDRNRARFRLRFGFTKTWWDKQLELGFRLASGSNNDSDSTNQTFTGAFSKKPVWIDLAYAKYKPKWAKGLVLTGGKMKNPIATKTLVTWDSDINPEGFHLKYEAPFFGDFKPYAAAGWWSLWESNRGATDPQGDTCRDSTLWTYELGYNWKITKDIKHFLGATYYQFNHWDVVGGAGRDGQWRHSGYGCSDMQVLEMTTKVKWKLFKLPMAAWGTWVHNCADDYSVNRNPNADRQFQDENNAFAIGMKVGKNKKKGDWSASYTYAYEELNSLPYVAGGGFGLGDSDFGGPNRQGHIIGGKYNLDSFLTLGAKVLITEPIHSDGATWSLNEDHTVTVQADMVWKF
ncbi:MAG: putative porin [Phycisphaerae bacterium]|nr:putative porin [Phycisphaerae bacterium]